LGCHRATRLISWQLIARAGGKIAQGFKGIAREYALRFCAVKIHTAQAAQGRID
jgi:hypothetical protein